jgi:uncharacterized membrane protein YgcG
MFANSSKKMISRVGILILIAASSEALAYQAPTPSPAGNSSHPTDAIPLSASELQSLVAPIALYPDALVAQILTASTFPDQIAVANYWLQQNKSLTGNALMQAVDKQSWDASVKALTEFPSVLGNMAKNLAWTSSLGQAYHNQQAEVMAAVQTLRAQAKAAGNLKSTSQMTVVQQSPQVIVIQPANPQVVYVPEYNPSVVYGTTYVTPGYSAGDVAAAGIIGFGAGIAVGAMMSGGCCGWGYSSWNCGWHGTAVIYHGGAYYGNAAWHGGYYNGGYHGYNSYRGGNTYNRNVSGNTINVNRQGGAQSLGSNRASDTGSLAGHDSGRSGSNAFSGMNGHSGGFGSSGSWSSRAESNRGWESMRSSGFSGGRFGGGGFGGGGFHGGGFRR